MLRVLGPIVVDGPDGPVSVGGPVPRRILSALLVRPGTVVPVDGLLDAAWGDDPPPSAERTLVSHITRLREALAHAGATPAVEVERRDAGYRLVVGSAAEAARLIELRGSAVEALVGALLDVRDSGSAAAEAEARLGEMPFRERLWELLVLALYRQGRQGDALEAYRRARVTLSDELGVDPGPALRR